MSKNIKTIPTSEYDAAISAVDKYVEGVRLGDNAIIAQAFNERATMYGFTTEGKLLGGPISNLYDYVNQHGAAPKIKTRIDLLDITPTTAVVRVDMEADAAGTDYTDFHTLIKLDGRWQIIAKTFHAYAA